eukprot:166709-Prymnesium_polylepis.3
MAAGYAQRTHASVRSPIAVLDERHRFLHLVVGAPLQPHPDCGLHPDKSGEHQVLIDPRTLLPGVTIGVAEQPAIDRLAE